MGNQRENKGKNKRANQKQKVAWESTTFSNVVLGNTSWTLNKGIKKVFVGMKDPNEKVNGAGIRYLERHNVKTSILNYKEENKELNKGFINLIKTKRPYMTLKICLSLDGKIYNLNRPKDRIGDRTQLNHANKLRKDFDGIMVGVNTILNDNPRLTYRGPKDKSYTQPRPIVLDSKLRTPLKSKIILEKNKPIIFIMTTIVWHFPFCIVKNSTTLFFTHKLFPMFPLILI